MFTGIIEEIGEIHSIQQGSHSSSLIINATNIISDIHTGDSICVNGVCLTVTSFTNAAFTADVMAETLRRSNLGSLRPKALVNLERAMPADGRFGGHIVSGHIDGTGEITNFAREDTSIWVTISTENKILNYIVEKGSVAIDGISLTVAHVDSNCFKVSLIPHTGSNTTLLSKKVCDTVNLECDIIGKYVERMLNSKLSTKTSASDISESFLMQHGFL